MTLRILLISLVVAIASVYGQAPVPVKAGDLAPKLIWTQTLAGGEPGTFIGRVAVIGFFPAIAPTSHWFRGGTHWLPNSPGSRPTLFDRLTI